MSDLPDDLDDLDDEPAPQPITRPARRAPEREPPASEEAEMSLLGACLLDEGATLRKALESGLTAKSFYWPSHQIIFAQLAGLSAAGQPIGIETLTQELMQSRQLADIGGPQKLIQLPQSTTAHAGYFIEKVRTLSILRDSIKAHTQAVEDAYSFTGDIDQFLQVTQARVEAVSRAPQQARRQDQLAALTKRRVQATTKPQEPVTRLYLADKPIATPGNLVTLISKAKTGKTAALGAATAAMVAATTATLDRDTFKFRASNPQGQAVIVIDTEQSPYDAWQCYERSLKRAGDPVDPPWLHHFALVGYSVQELHAALDLALAECSHQHGGIFAVILDGVADFVASVNDEAECNGLVTHLRSRSVAHNCPIICVIHSNEAEKAGDDGRGHLGKQLIRKAESNLLLKKSGDVTVITSDKQRKAPITEADGVAFQWSDEQQMHVSCGTPEKKKAGGRTRAHTIQEFWDIIPAKGQPPMTGTALHRFASQIAEIKPNTFKDLLAEATKDGQLTRVYDPRTGFSYVRAV